MKKLLTILLCGFLILGLTTGCTEEKEDSNSDNTTEEKSKGNCEVKECMTLLTTDMNLEEINEVIGFEGELDESSGKYIWQLTTKTKVEAEIQDKTTSLKATYDKEQLKDENIKYSVCLNIANNINQENYTYEEMVEIIGVEGNLESNTSTSKMYSWIDKEGRTFRATFSKSKDWKTSIVSTYY